MTYDSVLLCLLSLWAIKGRLKGSLRIDSGGSLAAELRDCRQPGHRLCDMGKARVPIGEVSFVTQAIITGHAGVLVMSSL